MSRDYAIKKIKEALHATRGNAAAARQQVISMAMQDPALLKELVRPHMTGIVAHAVNRVVNGKTEPESIPTPEVKAMTSQSSEEEKFGLDILKAIAGGESAQFGQENYGRPIKKQGVSQSHLDAIQAMIDKGHGGKF